MKKTNKRAAIYLRVSTSHQDTQLQRDELTEYAKARGWEAVIFEDKASGTNGNRSQLKEMMKAVRKRQVDLVLIWKLDRLFRSLKDLVNVLQEFNDLGVEFVSLRDNIDLTTATGKLMCHLLAAFAEFEASLIKARVNAGLAAAKKKGVKLGRPRLNKENEIIELRRNGYTYQAIQEKLGVSKGAVCRALSLAPKTS